MYEENPGTVTTALSNSSADVFDPSIIAAILELTVTSNGDKISVSENITPTASGNITVPAGTELAFITPTASGPDLNLAVDVPVVILQGTEGVDITFNAGLDQTPSPQGQVDRVVVGTAGADNIVIADNRNTEVVAGDGDTVQAGAGHDTVYAAQGDSTIIGGTGNDIVRMDGNEANYSVSVSDGHAVVENADGTQTVDIRKIQFVQLEDGEALIFAANNKQAGVSTLFETAFGRTADAGGLDYWFDRANAGDSLLSIAKAFTMSTEFAAEAAMPAETFVNNLYQNTFGRAGEEAGVEYWTNALEQGASRAELIAAFATIAAAHIDGSQTTNVEAEVIGSITLVTGIMG